MKDFLKNIASSAIGTFISIIVLCILFFSSITALIIGGGTNENISKIKPNSILKIKFDYPIYDSPNNGNDLLRNIDFDGQNIKINDLNLYAVLSGIDLASKNKNVSGILLELNNFEGPSGFASLKEIRDALIKFKKSGKFIWSYSSMLSQSGYYLASVSDSILIYPETIIDLRGLNMTYTFFTEALNEIGIKPEIIRSGKYKSAIEPFMLKKMSSEMREQTESLLNNIWNQILTDISVSRDVSKNELNEIVNNILETWGLGAKDILIDGQVYPQEISNLLKKKLNIETTLNKFGLYNEEISFVTLNDIIQSVNLKEEKDKIAIIYAEGEIADNESGPISPKIHSQIIREVKKNENIKAVILRVNSPGGSALASDMIWYELEQLKKSKPLIVSMGDFAASGGYYISSNASKIYASNNTITGSIGVFGLFFQIKDLLNNKLKLHFDEVNTNTFSNFGNVNRSFTTEEKNVLKNLIDRTYSTFLQRVADGRKKSTEAIHEIAQGRVWSGAQAKRNNLIDEIGGLNKAMKNAAEIAGLENYSIIEYPKRKDLFEIIFNEIEINYTRYNELKSLIKTKKNEKIKNLILNNEGIQTRMPIDIDIN